MALPGLGLQSQPANSSSISGTTFSASASQVSRQEDLPPRTEWRFEVPITATYTLTVLSGHAEIFAVELAPNQPYTFSGFKGALFTWHGCRIEVKGEAESEYRGEETEYAVEWLNVHGMLESAREGVEGPRVLVVGPDSVGKSSLVRSLAAWAAKVGSEPTVINLDPREGLLAPPGCLSAVTAGSPMDVESGYGMSTISGPTTTPVKTPLVYHYPYASPSEKPGVYKSLITRLALSVSNKLEDTPSARTSGLIIDAPGALNDPKSNYDVIGHLISEFNITLILTLGSERLYNDLSRRYATTSAESIPVLRISKPGGAVERDAAFQKHHQTRQIRQYFFGTTRDPLNPHSHTIPFGELSVWRANSPSLITSSSDSDDEYAPSSSEADFERMTPTMQMLGRLVAIKFCSGSETDTNVVRDSAVMGWAYVSEVDESKKRVRFLSPHPQRWGDRAVVWGGWPDAVADLVG